MRFGFETTQSRTGILMRKAISHSGFVTTQISLNRSTIQTSGSMEWTSTSFSNALVTESADAERQRARSESIMASLVKSRWNGSNRTLELISWRNEDGKRSWRIHGTNNWMSPMRTTPRNDSTTRTASMPTMLPRRWAGDWLQENELR